MTFRSDNGADPAAGRLTSWTVISIPDHILRPGA